MNVAPPSRRPKHVEMAHVSARGRPPREPALSEAEGPAERSEASSRRVRQYGSQRERAVSACLG